MLPVAARIKHGIDRSMLCAADPAFAPTPSNRHGRKTHTRQDGCIGIPPGSGLAEDHHQTTVIRVRVIFVGVDLDFDKAQR